MASAPDAESNFSVQARLMSLLMALEVASVGEDVSSCKHGCKTLNFREW